MTTPLEKAQQRIQKWIAAAYWDNPLNLSGLGLTELPENLFTETPNLRSLFLSSNSITCIPEKLFVNTPELLMVGLYDNFITSIPETLFLTTPNIQIVYLHDNRLTSLPESLFATNPSMQRLYFDGNRFAASRKENESIHDFMKRLAVATFIRDGFNYDAGWNRRSAAIKLWSELAYT